MQLVMKEAQTEFSIVYLAYSKESDPQGKSTLWQWELAQEQDPNCVDRRYYITPYTRQHCISLPSENMKQGTKFCWRPDFACTMCTASPSCCTLTTAGQYPNHGKQVGCLPSQTYRYHYRPQLANATLHISGRQGDIYFWLLFGPGRSTFVTVSK